MADSKITGLSADTAPTSDDLVVTVNDPAGTPANKKVTLANLALGLGGAWSTWSPTLGNLSGGTQTYAKYIQIGKVVYFRFKYTLGGAGVGGAATFTLPVTANSDYVSNDVIATGTLFDSSASSFVSGFGFLNSTTVCQITAQRVDSTYAVYAALSSTIPFTWATGDTLFLEGAYEAA